jgi:hypothetical protein
VTEQWHPLFPIGDGFLMHSIRASRCQSHSSAAAPFSVGYDMTNIAFCPSPQRTAEEQYLHIGMAARLDLLALSVVMTRASGS